MQLTPPGSACSITIGIGVSQAKPGSTQGLHLVVTDLPAVLAELAERGVDVSEPFHFGAEGQTRASTRSDRTTARTRRSAIPTATAGCSRRCRHRVR